MNERADSADDSYVTSVWEWCHEAFAAHGKRLSFPRHTDCKRTYQWRFAKALAARFRAWGFDELDARHYVAVAAAHGQRHGLLNKGMSLFLQDNLLEEAHAATVAARRRAAGDVAEVQRGRRFLLRQTAGPLTRRTLGGSCNLIAWHRAGDVPRQLLAVSKSMSRAVREIANIDPPQRQLLPTEAELWSIRVRLLADATTRRQLAAILEQDLRLT